MGLLGLAVNNLGYFGDRFQQSPHALGRIQARQQHGTYLPGRYLGRRARREGNLRVSTGAQDANGLVEGDEIREFQNYFVWEDSFFVNELDELDSVPVKRSMTNWSNEQNANNYNPQALATQHVEFAFNDYAYIESGNHTPLGLLVQLKVLAWGQVNADDFVILDYTIINNSAIQERTPGPVSRTMGRTRPSATRNRPIPMIPMRRSAGTTTMIKRRLGTHKFGFPGLFGSERSGNLDGLRT